jgi:histidinol-phosphate aminotransferase
MVRLNANENPLGPCPGAIAAMREALAGAYRYPAETQTALAEEVAALHGVSPEEVILGNGSSELLELSVAAFCDGARSLVVAEPTYEAVLLHARAVGDRAALVPLTPDYHPDLPAMLAAAQSAGLVYLCNPNNPTATVTPKAEVQAFLEKLPKTTMVVVDEAYCHYVESADYESVIPRVREHPNLIVMRTFSKVYGMAGLRSGYAIASPAAIARMTKHQAFNDLNLLGIAGARESLKDDAHVAYNRRVNQEVRAAAVADLAAMGYRTLPSQANFFMVDLRRPAPPVIQAMRRQGIAVGRPFPAVPNFLRVTVGTADQMRAFAAALRTVMA